MTAVQLVLAGAGFWAVNAAIAPQGDRANLASTFGRIVLFAVGLAFWGTGLARLFGWVA